MLLSRHSRAAVRDASAAAAAAGAGGPQGTRSGAAAPSDPVQRARQRMGYKNNWHRDSVETRQVTWRKPLGDEPVAIIGGGISGLACAQVRLCGWGILSLEEPSRLIYWLSGVRAAGLLICQLCMPAASVMLGPEHAS